MKDVYRGRAIWLVLTLAGVVAACRPEVQAPGAENQPALVDTTAEVSSDRVLMVLPNQAPAGADVNLTAAGFPPDSTLQIGFGPVNSEFEIIGEVRTDSRGEFQTSVTVPEQALEGQEYVFVVTIPGFAWKEISNVFTVSGDTSGGSQMVQVRGRLTDEGAECQAMRSTDGQLYTLTGNLADFKAGDQVFVEGYVEEVGFCMQGTTLNVQRIERSF
jgi:hypothetical protein